MAIIASEKCDHDEANSSATYHVEMKDFLAKRRTTRSGVGVKSDSFTVSWSSFNFEFYVSGAFHGSNAIAICCHNDEAWSVKVKVDLIKPVGIYWWGWAKTYFIRPKDYAFVGFINHRDIIKDLLDVNGSLQISLKVRVIDELVCGASSKILQKLDAVAVELKETKNLLYNKLKLLGTEAEEQKENKDLLHNRLKLETVSEELKETKNLLNNRLAAIDARLDSFTEECKV